MGLNLFPRSGSKTHPPYCLMCSAGLCSPKAEALYALRHCGRDLFDLGLEALTVLCHHWLRARLLLCSGPEA